VRGASPGHAQTTSDDDQAVQTAYISHPEMLLHDPGDHHPEQAARIQAIGDQLIAGGIMDLLRTYEAPVASLGQLTRVHTAEHVRHIESLAPVKNGRTMVDFDTWISHESVRAAFRAAGATVLAADLVLSGEVANAFCAVRPPGHHAERNHSMGFCLYNNIAVGVAHALSQHGLERVAIVDFDVHHGNGTEDIFRDEPRVLFCSSFQHPFYPHTPLIQRNNIVHAPLRAGAGSEDFRRAVRQEWLPALERFEPEMIFISAGFDGHFEDDMGQLNLRERDYAWVTREIVEVAERHARQRVVSTLEGGYALGALARSAVSHIRMLMGIGLEQGVAGPR
jgi:acetoin utilization deacetylase AcuC-like enzyme